MKTKKNLIALEVALGGCDINSYSSNFELLSFATRLGILTDFEYKIGTNLNFYIFKNELDYNKAQYFWKCYFLKLYRKVA